MERRCDGLPNSGISTKLRGRLSGGSVVSLRICTAWIRRARMTIARQLIAKGKSVTAGYGLDLGEAIKFFDASS